MKQKGHDSRAIANIFVSLALEAKDRLTIMSLLKYVYFAHGWTLGHTECPLICHPVEAWKHGPVVPEVYKAFRSQGIVMSRTVDKYRKPGIDDLSDAESSIIKSVYEQYSAMSPFRLSAITHADGTPWAAYHHLFHARIPNDDIKEYYQELIAGLKNKQ